MSHDSNSTDVARADGSEIHRPLFLLGSARSGTTWVQDVLADANELRTIFEPLNPRGDRRASRFAHGYRRPTDSDPELEAFLGEACSGSGMRLWWDLRVNPDHLFRWQSPIGFAAQGLYLYRGFVRYLPARGKPILTKLIRGNLLAGWLVARLHARTLLLVRHPCAVVASQRRLDPSAWDDPRDLLRNHLGDKRLVEEQLWAVRDELAGFSEPIEVQTALWCIENAIPMRSAEIDGVGVAYYEELLSGSSSAWRRAADTFGLPKLPSDEVLRAPSQQASSDRKQGGDADDQIGRWKRRFGPDELARVQRILDLFEIDFYSTTDPMPRRRSG